jgi:hypothetical protein
MEDDLTDLLPLPVQVGLNSSILDMYGEAVEEKEQEQAAEASSVPPNPDIQTSEEPDTSVQGTESDSTTDEVS